MPMCTIRSVTRVQRPCWPAAVAAVAASRRPRRSAGAQMGARCVQLMNEAFRALCVCLSWFLALEAEPSWASCLLCVFLEKCIYQDRCLSLSSKQSASSADETARSVRHTAQSSAPPRPPCTSHPQLAAHDALMRQFQALTDSCDEQPFNSLSEHPPPAHSRATHAHSTPRHTRTRHRAHALSMTSLTR